MGYPTYAATYPEDTLRLQEALKESEIEIPLGRLADTYHEWCEDYWCAGWLILDDATINAFVEWVKGTNQTNTDSDAPLFSVVHGNGKPWTQKEIEAWVSNQKDTNLVWNDITGFLIDAWGSLYIGDSCGNIACVDDVADMVLSWGGR